jgi:hypothetical protein
LTVRDDALEEQEKSYTYQALVLHVSYDLPRPSAEDKGEYEADEGWPRRDRLSKIFKTPG